MKADDQVIISDLLWQLATKAADENPQYWKDGSDSEDVGRLAHPTLSAMKPEHSELLPPGEVESLMPHIVAMLRDGTITAYSTFNGVRPIDVEKVMTRPSSYWVAPSDADKVRAYLGHSVMPTSSASPQNCEPGKARLTMEIDGRHAIPVRAIPFITKGRLAADDLARKLAGREKHFPGLENLVAYYLVDGKPLATEARDWVRVSNDLEAFKTNLREKHPNPDPENAYDARGANEWEQKSAWMLPTDCFVWRDEFDREYRAYRPDDIQGPNYAPPMLTDAAVGMIWEGFNVGAQDIADMAELVNNDCAIDWEFWIGKMPRLTAGQAARLMAALDPDSFSELTLTRDDRRAGAARGKARRFERLAAANHMTEATPAEWLAWADRLHEPVHSGFRIALAETTVDGEAAASAANAETTKSAPLASESTNTDVTCDSDAGLTRREKQILAIEGIADRLKYPRQQIPTGGKTKIRDICLAEYGALFASEHQFEHAWKAASPNRISMAKRAQYAGR